MKVSVMLFLVSVISSASGFFSTHHHPDNSLCHPRNSSTNTCSLRPAPTEIRGGWEQPLSGIVSRKPTQLHAIPPHVWTSLVPPFLGLYKSEYTVSLGYGFGVALTALSLWLDRFGGSRPNPLLTWHASALVFYGVRLSIFLVLRNVVSARIQEFNTNVERRAIERGNRLATRTPFILSCGMLYYGLSIPVWFTGKLVESIQVSSWMTIAFQTLIGLQWAGFGMGALGDITKTYVKRSEKNEKFLVTSGIFSKVRHPNYSGEIIGWTANALMGLLAAGLLATGGRPSATIIANVGLLAVGWIGIIFVLLRATSNLEERQKKDYSDLPKYQSWIESSWGGWQLPSKEKAMQVDHPTAQIELDESLEEDKGSGI